MDDDLFRECGSKFLDPATRDTIKNGFKTYKTNRPLVNEKRDATAESRSCGSLIMNVPCRIYIVVFGRLITVDWHVLQNRLTGNKGQNAALLWHLLASTRR